MTPLRGPVPLRVSPAFAMSKEGGISPLHKFSLLEIPAQDPAAPLSCCKESSSLLLHSSPMMFWTLSPPDPVGMHQFSTGAQWLCHGGMTGGERRNLAVPRGWCWCAHASAFVQIPKAQSFCTQGRRCTVPHLQGLCGAVTVHVCSPEVLAEGAVLCRARSAGLVTS